MVYLSPDVYTQGSAYCAGYIDSESSIMGFISMLYLRPDVMNNSPFCKFSHWAVTVIFPVSPVD